jgi:hypothetical protein
VSVDVSVTDMVLVVVVFVMVFVPPHPPSANTPSSGNAYFCLI